jgi:hypothetical protein
MEIKYAVYPGTITLYNGAEVTMTALELATAYGVQDEPYIEINDGTEVPSGEAYFDYIHLKMRQDNIYRNIKETAQDDDQVITYGQDFDETKTYTQETDPNAIDKDIDMPHN